MSRLQFTDAQIDEVKTRTDLVKLASDFGAVLRVRKGGKQHVGTCPMCGGGKKATRFVVEDGFWACAVCVAGGDCISLVMKATHASFTEAVTRLGGVKVLSPQEEKKLEEARAKKQKERERQAEYFRTKELRRCVQIWNEADDFLHDENTTSIVKRYLAFRHVDAPRSALLREARDLPYYDGEVSKGKGRTAPRMVHRGPAMVSPFIDNEGQMVGVHITWLEASGLGKAEIDDPDTGEELPAKKMRGTKAGSHLELRRVKFPRRLFLAEGIETVLSVAIALFKTGRLLPGDIFWAAGDLGNLGGPATDTVEHPTLKTPKGRPQRVPGPYPGEGAAIIIPAMIEDLVLLGDGDSDPFLTAQTMERARRRYARPGLRIGIAMADAKTDFNNMLEVA